jgi:hypothetical protein
VFQHGLHFALGEVKLAGQCAYQGQSFGADLSAGHTHGQGSMVFAPAVCADTSPAQVFGDDGLYLRQLEHLMAHGFVAVAIGLNGATAAALLGWWAVNHLVDFMAGEHGAVAAFVSGLSAQAFAALGACAWHWRCAWAVAGGWLGGVA